MEFVLIPLFAILLILWGTVIVFRGKVRLRRRTDTQGIAARLTGLLLIVFGSGILAAAYWAILVAKAVGNR
jgi:hypothetical protein